MKKTYMVFALTRANYNRYMTERAFDTMKFEVEAETKREAQKAIKAKHKGWFVPVEWVEEKEEWLKDIEELKKGLLG